MLRILLCIFLLCGGASVTANPTAASPEQKTSSQEATSPKPTDEGEVERFLEKENIGRPSLHKEGNYWQDFMNMLLVLGGLLVGLIIVGWILKRLMRSRLAQINFTSKIKIIDKRALHPKACIYYLEVAGKRFVVGEGQGGLSLLTEIEHQEDEEPLPPVEAKGKNFGSLFKSRLKKAEGATS